MHSLQIAETHVECKDLEKVFSNKTLLHYTDLDYCERYDSENIHRWISNTNRITWCGYENGDFVGFVSAHLVEKHLTASITSVIIEKYQHKGFAKQLLDFAVENLYAKGFARIEAQICTENSESVQLFESAGFTREGILRKNFLIDGILRDSYMYAKIVGVNL